MAALVCIAYSLGVHFYRVGRVFIESGGSIAETVNYLENIRNESLDQRYLNNLDRIYGDATKDIAANTGRVSRRYNNYLQYCDNMDYNAESSFDFIAVETAVEATENELRGVSIDNVIQDFWLCVFVCLFGLLSSSIHFIFDWVTGS